MKEITIRTVKVDKNPLVKNIFSQANQPEKRGSNGSSEFKSSRMTDALKRDIQVLNMRNSIDPTQRYKTNSLIGSKKFVQYGTVIDTSYEYYSNGGTSVRKKPKSILDSLMQDEEFHQKIRTKSQEIADKRGKRKFNKRK